MFSLGKTLQQINQELESPMMNIGILGASWIAQKAIIEPAVEIEQANVLALGCRDETRGKAYAQEHGIAQVFQDYDEMISSPELDVIYNGLPPAAHAPYPKRLNVR